MMTRGADELREIKDALEARGVELVTFFLGEHNRSLSNRSIKRWGKRGSFILNCTGKSRGRWHDFEGGKHGDLLSLIQEYQTGPDFAASIRWARNDFLGWGDGPTPEPRKSDLLRRQREERAAKDAAKEEVEAKAKAARAQKVWNEAIAIAGTIGETYLRDTRGISSLPHGAVSWPSAVRWHNGLHAIVVAVTDDNSNIVAVQLIAVTPDGRKDAERVWNKDRPEDKRAKHSIGTIGKGFVRLSAPHATIDAPICGTEGPETGLTVWAATGYPTVIALGGLRRLAELNPQGRRVVICRDDDARGSEALKAAKAAMVALTGNGFDVKIAAPFETRRGDKSDFNDLAQEQGLSAVKRRIDLVAIDAPVIAQRLVSVEEARQRIDARAGEFFDAVLIHKEELPPPVHAIGTSVGTGKTEAFLRHAIRCLATARANGDKRVVVAAVPEHRLSAEVVERFDRMAKAAGVNLRGDVWRGREAKLPGGDGVERMCADVDVVREALRLSVDVDDEVCAICPHKDGCSYLGQRGHDADFWVVAHQSIFHTLPPPIKRRGVLALVVDESPIQAGLIGVDGHPIELPVDALRPGILPASEDAAGERLIDIRNRLAMGFDGEDNGPISREMLSLVFLDQDSANDAQRFEWRRKITDGPWRERDPNRSLGKMNLLWRAVAALADKSGPIRSGWLTLANDREGARVIRICGRSDVGEAWQVPTLLVDALLDLELARHYWPSVEGKGQFDVDAPYQTIRQAAGKSFALRYLAPTKDGDTDADRSRARARRDVKAIALKRDRELGGSSLVVGNKSVVDAMGQFPAHVATAHYNAVAGRDHWKDARLICVVGRPMPSPVAVERMAGALTGAAPVSLDGGWYDRADGFRLQRVDGGVVRVPTETDIHPDQTCERIRSRICAGELVQAIGRGRGVNRGPDDPVEVLVLGDAVLPVPVDDFLPDEDLKPSPTDLMLSEGGIAFEDGSSASLAYPALWRTAGAYREAVRRRRCVTNSYKYITIGERDAPLPVTFQVEGKGQKPQRAWIDPRRVANPAAAIAAMVGPLVMFRVEDDAPGDSVVMPIAVGAIEPTLASNDAVVARPRLAEPIPSHEEDEDPPDLEVNDNAEPLPWREVWERARDAGLDHAAVAEWCGVSACHLSNVAAGRRRAKPELAAALGRFLSQAQPLQARLL